jgi:linoleoyl-CoA desaturase
VAIEQLNTVRFPVSGKDSFHQAIIAQVNAYFRNNKLSPYANTQMWVKTAVMISLYFVPYALMVSGAAAGHPFAFLALWLMMGIGMVGIGTSVMHDAHHGTYSANKKINKLIGYILELIGGYEVTWKIQHNYLHHTFTNVAGLDEDIDSVVIFRFSPRQPRYWFHRYQHIYAWFFYMIMTLFWMTAKDYLQVLRYRQHDLLVKHKLTLTQAVSRITLFKMFYYTYIIFLPLLFSGMPWYYIVTGFLIMHCLAGLILSCIFQPAHVVATSEFALPVESHGKKEMEDSWAVHEVENTSDFAPDNKFLTWFIGGLNFQVEHHLFTGICHVHYPKLAPLVRSTAEKFGVQYHVEPTFRKALGDHVRMLKKLGRED